MVEIVGCSTDHPTKVRLMPPRPSSDHCIVPECPNPVHARGRCASHYQSWRRTDSFERVPPAPPKPSSVGLCPMCGPWERLPSQTLGICPTCEMTAGEHAYRDRIMADSAAVYAQEVREFNARRRGGG